MFCLLSPSPFSERLRLVSRTGDLTMDLWEFNLFLPDSPGDAAGYRACSATSEALKPRPRDLRIIPRKRKALEPLEKSASITDESRLKWHVSEMTLWPFVTPAMQHVFFPLITPSVMRCGNLKCLTKHPVTTPKTHNLGLIFAINMTYNPKLLNSEISFQFLWTANLKQTKKKPSPLYSSLRPC